MEKAETEKRPEFLYGVTMRLQTGECGKAYVVLNFQDDGSPFEVFIGIGKCGGCKAVMLEGMGRMISLALRSGVDIKNIIKQLKGLSCPGGFADENRSCLDGLAQALEKMADDGLKIWMLMREKCEDASIADEGKDAATIEERCDDAAKVV